MPRAGEVLLGGSRTRAADTGSKCCRPKPYKPNPETKDTCLVYSTTIFFGIFACLGHESLRNSCPVICWRLPQNPWPDRLARQPFPAPLKDSNPEASQPQSLPNHKSPKPPPPQALDSDSFPQTSSGHAENNELPEIKNRNKGTTQLVDPHSPAKFEVRKSSSALGNGPATAAPPLASLPNGPGSREHSPPGRSLLSH